VPRRDAQSVRGAWLKCILPRTGCIQDSQIRFIPSEVEKASHALLLGLLPRGSGHSQGQDGGCLTDKTLSQVYDLGKVGD